MSTSVPHLPLAAALSLIFCAIAAAQGPSTTPGSDRCAALTQLDLSDIPGGPGLVISAKTVTVPGGVHAPNALLDDRLVPRGPVPSGYSDGRTRESSRIQQYCDITGYVAPQNKFELKLPAPEDWNQKFFFYVCGGFCGAVLSTACDLGLVRGYASVTANGGHDSANGFDGIWAANAPELQEDFGWRSTHVVTLVAKEIVRRYYGKPIRYSYIAGQSKGGQAVLMEAQRFPEDFDGYMPVAPVYDYTGRNTIAAAWFWQAVSDGHGGSVLNSAAAQAVHKSVLRTCGSQSGVEEGVVADPLSCNWKPEMAACSGAERPDCLSPRQVAAVQRLMRPATNSKGEVVYAYAYVPGTETHWEGWNYYGVGQPGRPPRLANRDLPTEFERYFVDERVRNVADPLEFDFDREPATFARSRRIYDALSFDLRTLKGRGAKVLLWHGWADAAIVATSSIGYYESVLRLMGGRKQTEDFFRLFLIPGVHHGSGGPGFTEFDAFSALENWVERGEAPDKVVTSRITNGEVERSRPVYPYPVQARYAGTGDPRKPENFVRFDPSAQH